MKSLHKLLIVGAAVLVITAVAVPVLHAQPTMVTCCDWEGDGTGSAERDGETYYFSQTWHALVIWRSADTTTDTIIGCWYDENNHGGNIFGYRVHATDSAFGVMYANDTEDDYCEDSIFVVPEQTVSANWKAKWTGCCNGVSQYVDGEWIANGFSGSGYLDDDGTDPTCTDTYGVCE